MRLTINYAHESFHPDSMIWTQLRQVNTSATWQDCKLCTQHYSAYTLLEAQPIKQNVQHLGLVWDNENQSHENNTIMMAEYHGGRHCLTTLADTNVVFTATLHDQNKLHR